MRPLFSLCINAALIVLRHERAESSTSMGPARRSGGGGSREMAAACLAKADEWMTDITD